MSNHIFRTYFFGSLAQKYLLDFAKWAKRLMAVGVVLQLMILGFAAIHFHEYFTYARKYPETAAARLISAWFETALAITCLYLYALFLRSARAFSNAASDEGTDQDLELAFKLNLKLIKYQFVIMLVTIGYYGYLFAKYINSSP